MSTVNSVANEVDNGEDNVMLREDVVKSMLIRDGSIAADPRSAGPSTLTDPPALFLRQDSGCLIDKHDA